MSEKVWLYTVRNNGYGCGCCGRTWDDEEWVEKEEVVSFETILNMALNCNPYSDFGDTIQWIYGDEDDYDYGYELWVNRDYADRYIWIGNERYPFQTKEKQDKTKEELMQLFEKYKEEKAGK